MKKSHPYTNSPFGIPKYSFTELGKKVFFLGRWQWGFLLIGIVGGIMSGVSPSEYNTLDVNGSNGVWYRIMYSLIPPTSFYVVMVLYNVVITLVTSLIKSLIKKDN